MWLAQGRAGRHRHSAISSDDRGAEDLSSSKTRSGTTLIAQGADRRLRPDHAVELADQPDRLQGRAGARRRLHHGAEAVRSRAAQRHHLFAEVMHEAGVPGGRVQPGQRRRPAVGEAMSAHPGHRHDVVHRLDPRRHPGGPGRRRHRQARGAGTGRQVGQHHAATTPTSARPSPGGVSSMMTNSGQSCNAPTRMFVPREQARRGEAIAKAAAEKRRRSAIRTSRRDQHRPGGQRDAVRTRSRA